MDDLISYDDAKNMLGCDDATLQNHINSGTIRSQRVDGELMLVSEDVEAQGGGLGFGSESEDGTIILSGDSEDLTIDLGDVVDDDDGHLAGAPGAGTEVLDFGDELDFDGGNTEQLDFDTQGADETLFGETGDTSFGTDAEETIVAAAGDDIGETGVYDETMVEQAVEDYEEDYEDEDNAPRRRSVRSQRVESDEEEEVTVSWVWTVLFLGPTLTVLALLVAPFVFLSMADNAHLKDDGVEASAHGSIDKMFAPYATTVAGFSIEPDKKAFEAQNAGAEWIPINQKDPSEPDSWRYKEYRGGKDIDDRVLDFVIKEVTYGADANGNQVPTQAVSHNKDNQQSQTFDVQSQDGGVTFQPILKY
ncbi:MAG: hypothetical protein ACYTF0_00140 [Planctomycetota bacterium]|jgi:hypothetical protein